ncbi:MAG: sigma-70 family RNA polymerase sigma factor [Myxococcales bacterium]|nr:sigma-70 family RNA polymerase sigma factor [Myxococcales bacterium]
MTDEVELLRRWQGGDAAAGDALLRSCFQALFRFFRNKVSGEVEDLIQRTLLACVESREEIRDPEQFRAFLFRVARNRLYDRLRGELRVGEQVNLSEASLYELGASPSSVVARNQRQALVGEALRRIPLDYQIALELSYWEGMKAPQIGEVLGLNPNTVRTRITRARAALKEQLAALGVAPEAGDELLPR